MMIIRNLTKKSISGEEILSKISLQLDEGELIALVGGSGSGKTTFLRCLSLREKWDEGELIYNNKELQSISGLEKLKLKKEWAFLEEKPVLNLRKTAVKNVLSGRFYQTPIWRILTRTTARDEHVLAMDYLEQVGLLDKAYKKIEELSGGERQRVAIARALVQGAKILFADEPVSGLDPKSAEQIMKDLQYLAHKEKVAVVCSLHNIEFAERYATRIWGIRDGKLVIDVSGRRLTVLEKNKILG